MARVDLTVRGGGIFGLACAWEAARRGARVRLVERHAIGAGSSGTVFEAIDMDTGASLAVKEIPIDMRKGLKAQCADLQRECIR